MAGIELRGATIVEVSQLVRSRRLSPVELIQATLDHIVAMNPALQAYTTVSPDYALRRARQAEKEIAAGQYRGPLHGIPYSLKDLIDTAGIRTTYGYRSHQDYVPRGARYPDHHLRARIGRQLCRGLPQVAPG
jgi:aspartyl-tRNA(Asn)/glutamyl-tRNA(Gln) amidotransferase subunit A